LSRLHRHRTEIEDADNPRPVYPGNSFNPPRPLFPALFRGFGRRCPACGSGRLFSRYLKVAPLCEHCGEVLHHARPDDAPAYFVMLIIGHVAVSLALALEETAAPPVWLTLLASMSVACVLTFALLPPVKGAIIALQWTLWMHGFDPHDEEEHTQPGLETSPRVGRTTTPREPDRAVAASGAWPS